MPNRCVALYLNDKSHPLADLQLAQPLHPWSEAVPTAVAGLTIRNLRCHGNATKVPGKPSQRELVLPCLILYSPGVSSPFWVTGILTWKPFSVAIAVDNPGQWGIPNLATTLVQIPTCKMNTTRSDGLLTGWDLIELWDNYWLAIGDYHPASTINHSIYSISTITNHCEPALAVTNLL